MNDLIKKSKQAIRLAADMSLTYYDKPLIIAYSGGKDSDVLLHLAEGCLQSKEYEVIHSHTTVDAPETFYHIRDTFTRLQRHGVRCTRRYARYDDGQVTTMWNLIPRKAMPPTRLVRYCCQVLKETGTLNRLCALGVRGAKAQSAKAEIFLA